MELPSGKYVVFGDQHGRVDRLQSIYDQYGDSVDGYISTGDVVDGLDTKGCLSVMKDCMNAIYVRGNHEQHLISAISHPDEEMRYIAGASLWPRVEDRVLESYGVPPYIATPRGAERLAEKMDAVGHLLYLLQSVPYVEGDNWIVLHANVTDEPWRKQKQDLDIFVNKWELEAEDRSMPYQFGEGVAKVNPLNLVNSGITKVLVSGHFHRSARVLEHRTRNQGQHLLLATWPDNDFSVVYETWTQQMRIIDS